MYIKKGELPTFKTFIAFLFCMKFMVVSIEGWIVVKGFSMLYTLKRIFSSTKSLIYHEVYNFFLKKFFHSDYIHKVSALYECYDAHEMRLLALGFSLWWCSHDFSFCMDPCLVKRWAVIDSSPTPDSLLSEQMSSQGIPRCMMKFEFWLEALTQGLYSGF